jgi:hypothetical protein
MSADRDVTRIVRSWLEEGVSALPDRVLDTVLDQLPATPQRRSWWPARRFGEMNNFAKFAVMAAAVVVVAIIGVNLLPRAGGLGGPGPSLTPSPSPSPTASPLALRDGPLLPGTYIIGPALEGTWAACVEPIVAGCSNTMGLLFTVPNGWSAVGNDSIWLTAGGNAPPAGAGLLFTRGAGLFSDPCHTGPVPDIPVGPTVEDFAGALAAHRLLDVTTPVDATLAGYSGRYVDLQVPADISGCDIGGGDGGADPIYRPWDPGLYAQGPSQRWHLWILDVDGQRVVVQSTDYTGTSAQDRAELQAIVASIKFDPPSLPSSPSPIPSP